MEITHFSHRHPLTLSNQTNSQVWCSGCRLNITGPAYICHNFSCKYFLHKDCAELPQQIDHPFHPPHPLLLSRAPHRVGKFLCNACRNEYSSGFIYHCSQCKFTLDIVCATLRLKEENQLEQQIDHLVTKKKKKKKKKKTHLSHQHPLTQITCHDDWNRIKCLCCYQPILKGGLIYVCFGCQFFIHKSCAELPDCIRHPFHQKRRHFLTLYKRERNDTDFKSYFSSGLFYRCIKCEYGDGELDIFRSRLRPITSNEEQIQHFSHEHPLTPVPCIEQMHDITCSVCSLTVEIIDGPIVYVCFDCNYFIHKSCVDLPKEIQNHPFHVVFGHSLALTTRKMSSKRRFDCRVCAQLCELGYNYHCLVCDFVLHVTCAMLMPTIGNEQFERQIKHRSHPHSLIPFQFDGRKGSVSMLICFGCEGKLGESSYVCPRCRFFLCRSCVEEFSKEIKHRFHPQHPLVFFDKKPDEFFYNIIFCDVCDEMHFGFFYYCPVCPFYMGLKCASLFTVKYELHQHGLAFMNNHTDFLCDICNLPCHSCFLRCVLCDWNLHVKCIPEFPILVRAKTHRHVLTLTDPFQKQGSETYYCDACETKRNPRHSVYYCAECDFAAHIECKQVIPLEEGSSNEEGPSAMEVSLAVQQLLDAGFDVFPDDSSEENFKVRRERVKNLHISNCIRSLEEDGADNGNDSRSSDSIRPSREDEEDDDNDSVVSHIYDKTRNLAKRLRKLLEQRARHEASTSISS